MNGHDTTSLAHVETVTLLRKLADVARLKLLRFPSTMETQQRVQAAQVSERFFIDSSFYKCGLWIIFV